MRKQAFFLILSIFTLQSYFQSLKAGGVVSTTEDAALRSAAATGGTVTFNVDGVITLTNVLNIRFDTVIDASGHNIEISGNDATRLLQVTNNISLRMVGLTLRNGRADTTFAAGGALFASAGDVSFVNCKILNNSAFGPVGGVGLNGNTNVEAFGGAIYSAGNISFTSCSAQGNIASAGSYSDVNAGFFRVGSAQGGFLYQAYGNASFVDSRIVGNLTTVSNAGGRSFMGNSFGGAIHTSAGNLSISNTLFATNVALAINGYSYGPPTAGGGAVFFGGNSLVVDTSRFISNSALGCPEGDGRWRIRTLSGGGAIWHSGAAHILRSEFSFNTVRGNAISGQGAGGAIASMGSLYLSDSEVAGNVVIGGDGRGYATSGNGADAFGGGVYLSGTNSRVERVSVHNNSVNGGGGDINGGNAFGAGIYAKGSSELKNLTVALNVATGGGTTFFVGSSFPTYGGKALGGGIYFGDVAHSILVGSTISSNYLVSGFGSLEGQKAGLSVANVSTLVNVGSSILSSSNFTGAVQGTMSDLGYNICSDSSVSFTTGTSTTNTNPLLGPLQFNGGYIQTMALLPGSPAIDRIPDGGNALATDARGVPRPQGSGSDIGAFEVSGARPPVVVSAASYKNSVGTWVAIYGTNLIFTTNASFGEWNTAFRVISDREVQVKVPMGFVHGIVRLNSPDGAAASSQTFSLGPVASSPMASHPTPVSVDFTASIQNDNQPAKVYLQYGQPPSYSSTTAVQSVTANSTADLTFAISNLLPNILVHARVVMESTDITNYSSEVFFSAPTPILSVQTLDVDSLTTSAATVGGFISANDPNAKYFVQFGRTANGFASTGSTTITSPNQHFLVSISNLVAGQVYFYRTVARDSFSSVTGEVRSLTTLLPYHGEGALSFAGVVGSYATVASSTNLTLFPMTVQVRFKTGQSNAYIGLVHKYLSSQSSGYFIMLTNGVLASRYGAGATLKAGFVADNSWHDASLLVTTNLASLYLDGILKASGAVATPSEALGVPITFAKYLNNYQGLIGEVSLWNRALSVSEIETSFKYVVKGNEPGLVDLWRFAGNGIDSTTSGRDLQLFGNASISNSSPGVSEPRHMLEIRPENGLPVIYFHGTPGQPFTVQYSTNLADWIDLPQQNISTSGDATLSAPNGDASQGIFYRTISP